MPLPRMDSYRSPPAVSSPIWSPASSYHPPTDRSIEAKTARLQQAKHKQRLLRWHGVAADLLLELGRRKAIETCRAFVIWREAPNPRNKSPPLTTPRAAYRPSTPLLPGTQKKKPAAAAATPE